MKQFIISIDREYGSGGHDIAYMLAEKYGIKVYDSNIIEYASKEKNINLDNLKAYDEKARNLFFSRSVDGHSNSPEDTIANIQFAFLKDKAEAGDSFVVLGRCANSVLKEYDCLTSIFITGNMPQKIARIAEIHNVTNAKAENMIIKNNKKRKAYHNHYCKEKWGDSRYYELTVNTSKIGIAKACAVIEKYLEERLGN